MSKNSAIDYLGYILFKTLGPFIRILPLSFVFFLGRRLGDLFYYFDFKHRALAYANIKSALGDSLSGRKIASITRKFYQSFGQNFMEILLIPAMDKKYMDKFIQPEGYDNVKEAFRRGKGVILLSMHAGSWELSNIICTHFGFPFVLFVREQKFPRLNNLLNSYRAKKSYKIIQRGSGARELITALKDNEAIGMMADQGGRAGTIVKFFGKEASMPSGAMRFALKYGAAIIPVYYTRVKGPKIKVIFNPIFEVKKSSYPEKDLQNNLQELMHVYEENIRKYPYEPLWTYKIWKYGNQRRILILSDAKAGHSRQSQAVVNIVSGYFKDKGINCQVDTQEVKFKSAFARNALTLSSCLTGKYSCQGCGWCLRKSLQAGIFESLTAAKPDIIISCGSSLAVVNYLLSRENLAKSIVILHPGLLSAKRFDLVIMPRHDNPPKRKNVAVIEGALNLIDEQYLKDQVRKLALGSGLFIGVLIGGDTKNFHLDKDVVLEVIRQVKATAKKYNAGILVTTSRRTSIETEELIKAEFRDYPQCKLLVIANEKNIPEAVGGILGLSNIVVVSPESISMVSEAASSGKYVFVFSSEGLSHKHGEFLKRLAENKYIYMADAKGLATNIAKIFDDKPQVNVLKDGLSVAQALENIL